MLKNIRLLREERNISQKQLADVVGISQQSINKYENHNVQPDIETLKRLAVYFDTSIDFLVGHTEKRHKSGNVEAYYLSGEEADLVDEYRKLNRAQRDCLKHVMRTFNI